MGSSCVNLSRAVAAKRPGFSVSKGGHAHGRSVTASSSLWKRGIASVACRMHERLSSSGGSRPSFSVHGKNSGACSASSDHSDGIGIAQFLGGKNFLITGGTGFLAKVLIEKILRTNPDVGKIYVLIKTKDSETALNRLQNEVVDTDLFKCLQEIYGKGYHSFVSRKLVPVVGDVREANIGIAPELADEIAEQVDIIVNSAANTTFDERYDVAMDINTAGPFRIMSFAHRFRRLKLFLHVSTAYVNGQRQGVVLEQPFRLGDTVAKELGSSDSSEHRSTVLDIEEEIKLAFDSRRHSDDSASFSQEMKDLGLERAKLHGWQDTYVFTKAMGEMVINSMRGDIPVVTIRPSVIESTWKDPFPGWMEGNRMMDPVVLYYGKGQLSGFLADPQGVLDVVPVDMVVNATLASMAKHGRGRGWGEAPGIHVYHVASSTTNPLMFGDLSRFLFQHFTGSPYSDAAGLPIHVPPMRLFDSMEQFASYVETDALLRSARAAGAGERLSQRMRELCAKSVEQTIHLGSIYQPYTFYSGRFDIGNTERLIAEMSAEEKARFHFDVRSIDWSDYITNVHIPGLRKHVLKGRGVAASATNPLLAAAAASV